MVGQMEASLMEKSEISHHELRTYKALKSATTWLTSREIAAQAKISPRTARAHVTKFVNLGLIDVAEVFPGHRYRWSEKADKRNAAYLKRLERAMEVFG